MRRGRTHDRHWADSQALLRARFGIDLPGTEVPDEIASLIDRRVTRRYTEQGVPDSLLDALLAAAQSAPAKSDLQQFSVVVMRDRSQDQADRRLDRHDGLDRHRTGLSGVVRRHAAWAASVRDAPHAARQ